MRPSSLQTGATGRQSWNLRSSSSRRRQRLRVGLALVAIPAGVVGVWALAAPRSFFEDFPGLGVAWVAELPRYSEHLVRDIGALNLGLAVLLAWAALGLERGVVRAALVAWLVYSVPHFVFHATHLGRYEDDSATSQMIALGLGILLPLILLVANERVDRRTRRFQ